MIRAEFRDDVYDALYVVLLQLSIVPLDVHLGHPRLDVGVTCPATI